MRIALPLLIAAAAPLGAVTSTVIDSFDAMTVTQPASLCPLSLVAGVTGQAIEFAWQNQAGQPHQYAYATNVVGTASWDTAAGISFWVKGDGSNHCGAIEFIWNGDYAQRYAFAFPLKSTAWTKISIPWRDLLPELSGSQNVPLDPSGAAKPSLLDTMEFGKWWYWRDLAASTYVIDDVRLESSITLDNNLYRPAGQPLARAKAKLNAGTPLTAVTMGDSLTDYLHNSNVSTNWPTYFKNGAQSTYGCTATVVNPAIGGTELRANVIMLPEWLQITSSPDLVTIFFGGNDWGAGMRGASFRQTLVDAIRRIRRATAGTADIMILTTCPSDSNWDGMAELADACRLAAADENAGLCDIYQLFHTLGATNRAQLFAADGTHLSSVGQQAVANAVLQTLAAGGGTSGTTTTTGTTGTTAGTTTTTGTTGATTGSAATTTGSTTGSTTVASTSTTVDTGGSSSSRCGLGAGIAASLALFRLAGGRRARRDAAAA
jgi:lysophospholipase L1-like esterase